MSRQRVEKRRFETKPAKRMAERVYNTVEEATKGVPTDVVASRLRVGDCGRCGWPKGTTGEHWAKDCRRNANPGAFKP